MALKAQSSVKPGLVKIAEIGQPRGLRGEVKVKAYTDEPESFILYGPLTDAQGVETFQVKITGRHKQQVIVRIKGVDDRTAAEALTGKALYIEQSSLPEPDEDEFYHSDLEGLSAELPDGSPFGKVTRVEDFGAGTMLDVAMVEGGTIVVPFTHAVVPVIDIKGGRLVIDPPEGLLEPGKPEPSETEEGKKGA